jgi:transcriptional regulator with XRE-family HTH domain
MEGLKQEALAYQLGGEWSQKRISVLEAKEKIDDDILTEIAAALKIPEDAIKNFNEETAINIISSTLNDNAGSINNYCTLTFNPIEKLVEALDQLRKVNDEKEALYERLVQSEKDKVEMLKSK